MDTKSALQIAQAERDARIAAEARVAALELQIEELHQELRSRDLDELTGMHNLRWLREFWSGLRQPAQEIGAVAFIDVDLLKRVNDTYGHKVGDRVITHVAATLIASGCYGVRYGGDEFLLLVPAGWDVQRTLDRVIAEIAEVPIPTRDDEELRVRVSCGARIVVDGMELHQMIQIADDAMYQVKRARSGASGCLVVA